MSFSIPAPWSTLLATALAGTHRTATPTVLPGLTPTLGAEADALEKQLLLTAANLRLAQRAGQRPPAGSALELGRAGAETWPALGPTAARLLHQLATGSFHPDVASEFAQLMRERQRRIPHRLLGQLVQLENYLAGGHGQAYGRRGQWLGLHCPVEHIRGHARQLEAAIAAAPDWQAGQPAEAQEAAISRLASEPPADKWNWLLAALPHQLPAGQLALLTLLPAWCLLTGEAPPAVLEPYMEAVKEQQYWVIRWLYRMPGSAQTARSWSRLNALLELRAAAADPAAPLAPRSRYLHIALPTGWAEGWQRDGIRSNPAYEPFVVKELLSTIAASRWVEAWGASPAEVVALWAQAHYSQPPQAAHNWPVEAAKTMLEGLQAAAELHEDHDLALALLRFMTQYPEHPYSTRASIFWLCPLVPAPELMRWLQSLLPTLPAPPWTRMYRDTPYQTPRWYDEASSLIYKRVPGVLPVLLPLLRAHFAQPPHPDQQPMSAGLAKLVNELSARGELSLLPWLEAELAATPAPPALGPILQKALTTLALRRDLAASLRLSELPALDTWPTGGWT